MKKFVCILMALLSVAVVFACSREPEYKNPISKEQLSEFLREKQYISTSPITFKFSLNYDSTTYEDLRSEDNLATKKFSPNFPFPVNTLTSTERTAETDATNTTESCR